MALKFSEECAPLVADATGAYPEEEAGAYPWGTGLWLYVEGGRGGRGYWSAGMWCWSRIGSGLYLCWTWLLLEDGVVAKTLALALLAVSADGVGFVAL
jgi:hypothetical protein